MSDKYSNYRIDSVKQVIYGNIKHTFFALYEFDSESNSYIYDHTGHIKGHYKRKDAILNRYFN